MYRYETHLHTYPVSRCAKIGVEENLAFYKEMGYDGVFITNHFLDGNANLDGQYSYEDGIRFFFSDYEKGVEIGKKLGIKVFSGVELSYKGTDFLIYGLDKEWFLAHPEIMEMDKRAELRLMMESGALVIHAHPYREAAYIDHIRLYPRDVHGVEILNTCRRKLENKMAEIYGENYGLIPFAGSDNHMGAALKNLTGVCCEEPILDEQDFVRKVKNGQTEIFVMRNEKGQFDPDEC